MASAAAPAAGRPAVAAVGRVAGVGRHRDCGDHVFRAAPVNLPAPAPAVAPQLAGRDDEPYAMASADEVQIVGLPEEAAHLLVVGEHPLRGQTVVLAKADEVEFLGIGTDLAGRFPELPTEVAPDDAPMICSPRDP